MTENDRELLVRLGFLSTMQAIPAFEYREMDTAGQCCGSTSPALAGCPLRERKKALLPAYGQQGFLVGGIQFHFPDPTAVPQAESAGQSIRHIFEMGGVDRPGACDRLE